MALLALEQATCQNCGELDCEDEDCMDTDYANFDFDEED